MEKRSSPLRSRSPQKKYPPASINNYDTGFFEEKDEYALQNVTH